MPTEQLVAALVLLFFAAINWLMRRRSAPVRIEREPEPPPFQPEPPFQAEPAFEAEPALREEWPLTPPPAPVPPRALPDRAPALRPPPPRRAHVADALPAAPLGTAGVRRRRTLRVVPEDRAALRRAIALALVLGPPRALDPEERR